MSAFSVFLKHEYILLLKILIPGAMAAERSQNEKLPVSTTPSQTMSSCRKKKNENATFLEDVKDHIDEFIHASMDEHKTCFQKTIKKVLFNFLIFKIR